MARRSARCSLSSLYWFFLLIEKLDSLLYKLQLVLFKVLWKLLFFLNFYVYQYRLVTKLSRPCYNVQETSQGIPLYLVLRRIIVETSRFVYINGISTIGW